MTKENKFRGFIKDNIPEGKTISTMASHLRVTQPVVSNWLTRGNIPVKYLFDVADYIEESPREIRKLMWFKD